MRQAKSVERPILALRKFQDPVRTATGERRAAVRLSGLKTLWFNTGTLCNLTCSNCYIESSPTNDRLAFLTVSEVAVFLDELVGFGPGVEEIAFTGGEPFMNPDFLEMIDIAAGRGYRVLVLTNAMRPMMKRADDFLRLREIYGDKLTVRVSLDHYSPALHDLYRGPRVFERTLVGLRWLSQYEFRICLAGRTIWQESESELRDGFACLCEREGIAVDTSDPTALVLFPEIDLAREVPEISDQCWSIMGISPEDMMCASSRMIVKRKGAKRPVVLPCTLLPYDQQFELGETLGKAADCVYLNHPNCSAFCVLGGGSCGG